MCLLIFLQIENNQEFANIENPHSLPLNKISSVVDELEKIAEEKYFENYKDKIKEAVNILAPIFDEINRNHSNIEREKRIKNIIVSELSGYNI